VTRQRRLTIVSVVAVCASLVAWWIVTSTGNATNAEIQGLQQDNQGWSLGGLAVRHGHLADFTVAVLNKLDRPITLESIQLIAGEKELLPRLAHVGVFNGRSVAGSASGWPPKGTSPVVPLRGYSGSPGWIEIAVGLSGRKMNVIYGVIGVRLTYRSDGASYSAVVTGSGGQFCVVAPRDAKSCLRRIEAIQNKYY
jgi:hypothetical protein